MVKFYAEVFGENYNVMISECSHYHKLVTLECIQFLSSFVINSCESVNRTVINYAPSLHKIGLICNGVVWLDTLKERMLINLELQHTEYLH
jgi:hypothetical protein